MGILRMTVYMTFASASRGDYSAVRYERIKKRVVRCPWGPHLGHERSFVRAHERTARYTPRMHRPPARLREHLSGASHLIPWWRHRASLAITRRAYCAPSRWICFNSGLPFMVPSSHSGRLLKSVQSSSKPSGNRERNHDWPRADQGASASIRTAVPLNRSLIRPRRETRCGAEAQAAPER